MNILVISDTWPSEYSGIGIRIINIFKNISKEHEVHFLYIGDKNEVTGTVMTKMFNTVSCVYPNEKCSFLGRILNVLFFKPGAYARWKYRDKYLKIINSIREIVSKKNIDGIHVFSFFTAQYAADIKCIFKIWDVGDSYYLGEERSQKFRRNIVDKVYGALYMLRLFNYEQEMIKKYDRTVFVSQSDADVHRNISNKIVVIPNGVDVDYFTPKEVDPIKNSIIFTGHMAFGVNIQAVFNFIENIFPLIKMKNKDAKLYIVGAEPTAELMRLHNGKDIEVTGAVEDMRPFLNKAEVFVAPLVSGSGIKNKVLQAMAMGKPIVATSLGVEALSVKNGEDIIVADNKNDFANKVIALLQNETLRKEIGCKARLTALQDYSWASAIRRYINLYDLLNKRKNEEKGEVTILIPTRFDSRFMIELCLETVRKYTDYPYRIIVGNAGVNEETQRFLEQQKDIKLVKVDNPSLPKDSMIKYVNTPYFLFLHDDTQILESGWLERRIALMEKDPRNAIVGPVVANFVYGWKRYFLYKKTMRRFWPLVLLVKTDVQREINLHWGVVDKFDTGGKAYQQFMGQKKYKFVKAKFHKEIQHFGGMTWPVKKKNNMETASFNIDEAVNVRDRKLELIKEILISKAY